MYLGHGSWVPFAIFGVMFALRYGSSQRRRAGRRGPGPGPVPGSRFTDAAPPPPQAAPQAPPLDADGVGTTAAPEGTGTSPAWYRDPFVRHEYRYWSGTEWTEHVIDDGVPSTDPPPASPSATDAD